ncbi:MAG: threonylcarbamoyl-AMP synthase [Oscillospiraceae bacterium]|nr:threonylcarbamoyl-AMP synthase [Oscillospiraceae bacterium]
MINTLHLNALDPACREEAIEKAAELLRQGKLVIIPTETVYGLAANALDAQAVSRIFVAKGRPQDNPLIVHISDMAQLDPLVREVPRSARLLAEKFWPGPLTMVMPKSQAVPDVTSGGLDTVAVRMPSHQTARDIIEKTGLPLAAPSANLSGSPSPTTAHRCAQDMDGRVEAIVVDEDSQVGVESTVIALHGEDVLVLRPGAVTPEDLASVLGGEHVIVHSSITAPLQPGEKAESPGMKYKHYAPKAEVTILRGSKEAFAEFAAQQKGKDGVYLLRFEEDGDYGLPSLCYGSQKDPASQAHRLFEALRELDELGAKTVYAHCPEAEGVGLAVYNRLLRAAAFRVIDLE